MITKVLCDADFLIAFLIENEHNHQIAKKLLEKYEYCEFIHSNLTKYELMTVLSRKLEQKLAIKALELFEEIFVNEYQFDIKLEPKIINFYKNSVNKNQSFFDIACLIQAKEWKCKIASFDQFYPKEILLC